MNQNQKMVLVVAIAVAALMLLYAPTERIGGGEPGFELLFDIHRTRELNGGQLVLQWILVGAAAAVGYVWYKG